MLKGTSFGYKKTGATTFIIKLRSEMIDTPAKLRSEAADPSSQSKYSEMEGSDPAAVKNTPDKKAMEQATSATTATKKAQGESHDDFVLEEVVVTATKRNIKLQNVPMAVTAINDTKLKELGAAGFEDFVNNTLVSFFGEAEAIPTFAAKFKKTKLAIKNGCLLGGLIIRLNWLKLRIWFKGLTFWLKLVTCPKMILIGSINLVLNILISFVNLRFIGNKGRESNG